MSTRLPAKGVPRDELFATMGERKKQDADWRAGRTWSLVYPAGEEVDSVLKQANELYLYENALNPFRFPSLRQMEVEVDRHHDGPVERARGRGRRHDLGRHREHHHGHEGRARARTRRART